MKHRQAFIRGRNNNEKRMTDEEYKDKKGRLCKSAENCSHCPFGEYAEKNNIHACGSLCEVIEFNNYAKAVEIVDIWNEKE